jgi:hypothetical protein
MHECDGLKKSAVPNGIGNKATLPPTLLIQHACLMKFMFYLKIEETKKFEIKKN